MTAGLCVVCGKPCIAMCPACTRFVHHAYGQYNENCSGRHEAACPGARSLREIPAKEKLEFPRTKLPPPAMPTGRKKRKPKG